MINYLFLLTAAFFLISIIKESLFWLSLWQIKEYRWDRLRTHLKETDQGRKLIKNPENILKLIVFSLFILFFLTPSLAIYYPYLVLLLFLFLFLNISRAWVEKRLRLPVLTVKSGVIFSLNLSVLGVFFLLPYWNNFWRLTFLSLTLPILLALEVGLVSIPSRIYSYYLVSQAQKKRSQFEDLLVIGITGSYGKGSTKEYLATLLSEKFKVLKTIGSQNTLISLSHAVLSRLDDKPEIFIAELGAYRKGDIRELAQIVQPKIGILTGISDQHLSLFGSLNEIKEAKFELIEALPEDGLALFNGNSPECLDLAQKTNKKKVVYYADYLDKNDLEADLRAFNIKINKFNLEFDVSFKGGKKVFKSLKAGLLGKYHVENLLPVIYLADQQGLSESEIRSGLEKIKPLEKTMEPLINSQGTILINDTFNASFVSALAALTHLKNFERKKVLVLHPLLELGDNARKDHYDLGLAAGRVCDDLILTNSNFYEIMKGAIKDSGGRCEIKVMKPAELVEFIQTNLGKDDAVVFEGKEANLALSKIKYGKVYA